VKKAKKEKKVRKKELFERKNIERSSKRAVKFLLENW
jgi:hypothetical protein